MADCSKNFDEFLEKIRPSEKKKDDLRVLRDEVRSDLREHFKQKDGWIAPKFYMQGSFSLQTMYQPKAGEIDLDDGVYFLKEEGKRSPKPKVVYSEIAEGVKKDGRTVTQKSSCVRVVFDGKGLHLDLPAYMDDDDEYKHGSYKEDAWNASDPKEFREWFLARTDEFGAAGRDRAKACVTLLKAWAEKKSIPLTGIAFTIAVGYCFVDDERIDRAFRKTIDGIIEKYSPDWVIVNPVTPKKDVAVLSDSEKREVENGFRDLAGVASKAVDDNTSRGVAEKRWKSVFDDRFPEYEDAGKADSETSAYRPPIVKTENARPWCNLAF